MTTDNIVQMADMDRRLKEIKGEAMGEYAKELERLIEVKVAKRDAAANELERAFWYGVVSGMGDSLEALKMIK